MTSSPGVTSQLSWHVAHTGLLSSWKGQHFDFIVKNTLDIDLPSLHMNALVKTTIYGLIECLIHCHGIPQSIASDQKIHLISKKVQQ